jgi:hypothetical protein
MVAGREHQEGHRQENEPQERRPSDQEHLHDSALARGKRVVSARVYRGRVKRESKRSARREPGARWFL